MKQALKLAQLVTSLFPKPRLFLRIVQHMYVHNHSLEICLFTQQISVQFTVRALRLACC